MIVLETILRLNFNIIFYQNKILCLWLRINVFINFNTKNVSHRLALEQPALCRQWSRAHEPCHFLELKKSTLTMLSTSLLYQKLGNKCLKILKLNDTLLKVFFFYFVVFHAWQGFILQGFAFVFFYTVILCEISNLLQICLPNLGNCA